VAHFQTGSQGSSPEADHLGLGLANPGQIWIGWIVVWITAEIADVVLWGSAGVQYLEADSVLPVMTD